MAPNLFGGSTTLASDRRLLLGCLLAAALARGAQPPPAVFSQTREIRFIPPDSHLKTLRVVSWNIDHGAGLDRIVTALREEPPGLCLFQEVDSGTARMRHADVTEALARRLHLNAMYGIEFEELSQEGRHPAYSGQATLTRLPVRRSRILRFQNQSGFWEPRVWIPSGLPLLQRRLGSRIALVTELDWNGHLLVVYNAHLESRSYGRLQMRQLDEMLEDLKKYPAGTPVILGGDLNTKYMPSIFLHKLEQQGFQSALGERIERTHTIAMALDWIFIRGPLRFESGKVRKDVGGSDHYPVYADVVLTKK